MIIYWSFKRIDWFRVFEILSVSKINFFIFIQRKRDASILKPGAEITILKDIAVEAERLEIKENKGIMVLVELLFDDNVIKQVNILKIYQSTQMPRPFNG